MKESEKYEIYAADSGSCWEYTKLEQLKHTKFLTQRVFQRISENISYEVCKYVNSQDLLQIRTVTLGGFQLVSSTTLRARIKIISTIIDNET